MPLSALRQTPVDHKLTLAEIAPCLMKLSGARLPVRAPHPSSPAAPTSSPPSAFVCPECGGPLTEQRGPSRRGEYRCEVGHGFTLPALASDQERSTEAALWRAMYTLRERAELLRRLAGRTGVPDFTAKAEQAERDADVIAAMLPGLTK